MPGREGRDEWTFGAEGADEMLLGDWMGLCDEGRGGSDGCGGGRVETVLLLLAVGDLCP